jgi:predicted nuclease with TOPRIM domain
MMEVRAVSEVDALRDNLVRANAKVMELYAELAAVRRRQGALENRRDDAQATADDALKRAASATAEMARLRDDFEASTVRHRKAMAIAADDYAKRLDEIRRDHAQRLNELRSCIRKAANIIRDSLVSEEPECTDLLDAAVELLDGYA